jgi:hypothetical protein
MQSFQNNLLNHLYKSVESLYEASQSALEPCIVVHSHLVRLKKWHHLKGLEIF